MSEGQETPGGCASIVAITIVAFTGIFIWSQISASCSSPPPRKTTRQIAMADSASARAFSAGERDGVAMADMLAKDGGKRIPTEDGIMLLAQTRARVTNVPKVEVFDWTKGFCEGYKSEMSRLGK